MIDTVQTQNHPAVVIPHSTFTSAPATELGGTESEESGMARVTGVRASETVAGDLYRDDPFDRWSVAELWRNSSSSSNIKKDKDHDDHRHHQ